MQRTYRERKHICGEYMEVEIFPVYTKAKGRGKRKKPTSEIQQRLNQRHAEAKLRRLLHTNFTEADLFVTLTFDDAHLPPSVEDAQKLLQNFIRKLKRRYAKLERPLKYVYILEKGQENSRLHVHMVISGGMNEEDLEALWAMGKARAAALEFNEDGLAALAKYFTKGDAENGGKPITWKRWVASRNLEKPVVEEHDRRLPHYKMAALCQDGGDTDYLETEYCGYEIAPYTVQTSEDIYGGYYLAAVLKKMPPKEDAWVEIWGLPFG
jgi:hypothetical protein